MRLHSIRFVPEVDNGNSISDVFTTGVCSVETVGAEIVRVKFYSETMSLYEEKHSPDRTLVGTQVWTVSALTDALLLLTRALNDLRSMEMERPRLALAAGMH